MDGAGKKGGRVHHCMGKGDCDNMREEAIHHMGEVQEEGVGMAQ